MWCVEDYRDTPMRVRASFDNLEDAQRYGTEKFGEYARVFNDDAQDVREMALEIDDLRDRCEHLEAHIGDGQ